MGKKLKCMIIGASPVDDASIFDMFNPKDFFVICADGGFDTAVKYGIIPDLVVGDFDSAKKRPPKEIKTIAMPKEKDVTDTMFAVLYAMKSGYDDFTLLGCLGGERFDHSLANIETLYYITERGGNAVAANGKTTVMLLGGGRLKLRDMVGITVSVFSYNCEYCEVTYRGMEYSLTGERLACGRFPMGVSNSIVDDYAEICVHSGMALVVMYDGQP